MGQLIEFPVRKAPGKDCHAALKPGVAISESDRLKQTAKVLFFTGVRYERRASLPSERLMPPLNRA